jgi:hypothetical protein
MAVSGRTVPHLPSKGLAVLCVARNSCLNSRLKLRQTRSTAVAKAKAAVPSTTGTAFFPFSLAMTMPAVVGQRFGLQLCLSSLPQSGLGFLLQPGPHVAVSNTAGTAAALLATIVFLQLLLNYSWLVLRRAAL